MLHKAKAWLATFDGASARYFSINWAVGALTPVQAGPSQFDHHPNFQDAPATTYKSYSTSRGAGDHHPNAERMLEAEFVREVVNFLTAQCENHAFEHLIIAATPRALGDFRDAAGPELTKHVAAEIHGDYVRTPVVDLYAIIARRP